MPPRRRIFLVHWHEAEAEARAGRLRDLGYTVVHEAGKDGAAGRRMRELLARADGVVIDLGRLPSHGRHFATFLRQQKATRHLPLVFVAGDPAKTARVRAAMPDATFTTWQSIGTALRRALTQPVRDPVVPAAPDYSGTPLGTKLGIRPGHRVLLLGAPRDFRSTLGELPADVTLATRAGGAAADVILLFSKALADLQRRLPAALAALAERGGLWLCWPKRASGALTDLDGNKVRAVGQAAGLVDNKICAIDATWSGHRFARRRGTA